jgi:histidyl-tRNA synthetase
VLREIDKLGQARRRRGARDCSVGEAFGIDGDVVDRILGFVQGRSTSHADALSRLDALLDGGAANATLAEGAGELREVLEVLRALGIPETNYALNFSIARGLDYYTGTVYETTLDDFPQIGSICSGGRYENLAGHYTKSSCRAWAFPSA